MGKHITGIFKMFPTYFPRSVMVPVPTVKIQSASLPFSRILCVYSSFAVTLFSLSGYNIQGIEFLIISLHLFPPTSQVILSERIRILFPFPTSFSINPSISSILLFSILLTPIVCLFPHLGHKKVFPRYS